MFITILISELKPTNLLTFPKMYLFAQLLCFPKVLEKPQKTTKVKFSRDLHELFLFQKYILEYNAITFAKYIQGLNLLSCKLKYLL